MELNYLDCHAACYVQFNSLFFLELASFSDELVAQKKAAALAARLGQLTGRFPFPLLF
jgi:hypothetical protein